MDSSNRPQNLYYWPSDDQDGSTIPVIPLETPISSPGPDPSLSKSSSLPPESESFPSLSRPPPTAKSMDVSSIHGNVSDKAKRFVVNLLNYHYYGGVKEESFGLQIGRRLKLKSMNVWAPSHAGVSNVSNVSNVVVSQVRIPKRATEAQTVFEIIVAKDMCNPFGTLHGACACYIVDPCAMSAIVVLGAALGVDSTGLSQSMNLIWHRPAKMGTLLRVVSTSVFIEGRIRTARVEIIDTETEKLYVSAVHSTINPGSQRPQPKL